MTPASPLPWKVGQSQDFADYELVAIRTADDEDAIAELMYPDDAAFAVHAANCYPELLAALKALVDVHHGYHLGMGRCVCAAHEAGQAAIANAEGHSHSLPTKES